MQTNLKRSTNTKPVAVDCPKDVHIDIQKQRVMLLFPNQPSVNFSIKIPDLRCAGWSPAYTYKAWVWCMYINALHKAKVQLGFERNQRLFRKIWRHIQSSKKR